MLSFLIVVVALYLFCAYFEYVLTAAIGIAFCVIGGPIGFVIFMLFCAAGRK